jgi:hypothetical protein
MLLTDSQSVPVRHLRDDVVALAEGQGDRLPTYPSYQSRHQSAQNQGMFFHSPTDRVTIGPA